MAEAAASSAAGAGAPAAAAAKLPPLARCTGVSIAHMFPRPFWMNFPFGHPNLYKKEGGIVVVEATTGVIRHPHCSGAATKAADLRQVMNAEGMKGDDMSCKRCAWLQTAPWLAAVAVSANVSDGAVLRLHRPRSTFAQLASASDRRASARDAASLAALGTSRRLSAAYGRVEVHDQLLHAMADGNVPRLSALISVSLRAGRGPGHIARMLALAKTGAYKAKGFTMLERDIMLLVLRLGHRGLAFAVAQALGLPSISTALARSMKLDTGVVISHSSFEVKHHVRALVSRAVERAAASYKAAGHPGKPLYSLVVDATVVTAGPGVSNGSLTGLCQCCAEDVRPTCYDDIVNIANKVKSGVYHHANNVDVFGLVDLLGGHHGVDEVLVRGTCGGADAAWHASMTSTIQDVWREEGFEGKFGPLVQCAHDGAAAMRAAGAARRRCHRAAPAQVQGGRRRVQHGLAGHHQGGDPRQRGDWRPAHVCGALHGPQGRRGRGRTAREQPDFWCCGLPRAHLVAGEVAAPQCLNFASERDVICRCPNAQRATERTPKRLLSSGSGFRGVGRFGKQSFVFRGKLPVAPWVKPRGRDVGKTSWVKHTRH